MEDWINNQLKNSIRNLFEPRYKRKLTDAEIIAIAENLSTVTEILLKNKWRQKYETRV